MTERSLPCPTLVRLLLDCDYDTGKLTWRKRPVWLFKEGQKSAAHNAKVWNVRYADKPAFTAITKGYFRGSIFNIGLDAHRIVFCHKHGSWPKGQVDHDDGDGLNNATDNLHDVTHGQNTLNKSMTRRNKTGHNGVHWCKKDKRWVAQISHKNKSIHLGQFREIEDAIVARKAAEEEMGFHKNHGRPLSSNSLHIKHKMC